MDGYIKFFRSILDWRWFRDPAVAHLYTYLLLRASYTEMDWHDIAIGKGQLITSRHTLSVETGLSEKVVRRCLKALEKTGEISIKPTTHYTLITICKYAEYQMCNLSQELVNNGPSEDQQESNDGPAKDQQRATIKERKKERKQQDCYNIQVLDFEFVDPALKDAFAKWLKYKKDQFDFQYKSMESLRSCYNKLAKLAGNDSITAMAVVDQSIANSWKGLFDINDNKNGNNKKEPISTRILQDAATAAEFSRQLDNERRANLCGRDSEEIW